MKYPDEEEEEDEWTERMAEKKKWTEPLAEGWEAKKKDVVLRSRSAVEEVIFLNRLVSSHYFSFFLFRHLLLFLLYTSSGLRHSRGSWVLATQGRKRMRKTMYFHPVPPLPMLLPRGFCVVFPASHSPIAAPEQFFL